MSELNYKTYQIKSGKFGKYISVVAEDETIFNISVDKELQNKINEKNLPKNIFENLLKIFHLKKEIKKLLTENIKLLSNFD